MTQRKAPYADGDLINMLRDDTGGTCWGPLRVERVVALNDGAHWRVETTRNNGTPCHVVVDARGNDANGYASRPTLACVHCGSRLYSRPGHSGRYAFTDCVDGTDTLGSGSECPVNERGHEIAS